MAKIIVEGSEATVTVTSEEVGTGPHRFDRFSLQCDKGAWCPRANKIKEFHSMSLAIAVVNASQHADHVMHA